MAATDTPAGDAHNQWQEWNDPRRTPLDEETRKRREADARRWLKQQVHKGALPRSENEGWGATEAVELIGRVLHMTSLTSDGSLARVEPADLAAAMCLLRAARMDVDKLERQLIMAARHQELPWRFIADALGLQSPQAAAQRWQRLMNEV